MEKLLVLFHGLASGLLIKAGPVRIEPGKQGRSGRATDGALAMGIDKEHTPLGQPVDVWRSGLRMTVHAPYPIIKIVDGDQEGIRLGLDGPSRKEKKKKAKNELFLHGTGISQAGLGSYNSTLSFLPLLPFWASAFTPLKVLRFDPSPTFTV